MTSVTESLTRTWLATNFDSSVLAHWEPALPLLRPEERVLTPTQMRHSLPTNGSLADTLIKRIIRDKWRFVTLVLNVDEAAGGDVAYRIDTPDGVFTFGVRSVVRPDSGARSGRLRENTFDFYGCIFAGDVTPKVLAAEHDEQVAASWKGRTTANALGWSFANRGSRSFDSTIDALAHGHAAPLEDVVANGGYLVRNAGFYGNGRHGSVPWLELAKEGALSHPYHLDLVTLFMLKLASFDFVEEAARERNPRSSRLTPEFRRRVGVGNSSGIGTVATLVKWPTTLSAITLGRELAVARGRHLLKTSPTPTAVDRFAELMTSHGNDTVSTANIDGLTNAVILDRIKDDVSRGDFVETDEILDQGRPSPVTSVLVSAMADVDPKAGWDAMPIVAQLIRKTVEPDRHATVDEVTHALGTRYGWVRDLERAADVDRTHFWYRSSENGENRRGERAVDPGVERETFVDVASAIRELTDCLAAYSRQAPMAEFLLAHPHLTGIVGRVLLADRVPYTEIRANLVSRDFAPADVIHYFLTGLGIQQAQPASELWVGGVFMADLPAEVPLLPKFSNSPVAGEQHPGAAEYPVVSHDAVRMGYPELRRVVPDVLRAVGVPAAITAEAAELVTWTEAATGTGVSSLLDLRRVYEMNTVQISERTIDLHGQSLILLGVRVAEYVTINSDESISLKLNGALHPGVLPYLSALLARRGLRSMFSIVDAFHPRDVIWGTTGPAGETVLVDRRFLASLRHDPYGLADVILTVHRSPLRGMSSEAEDVTRKVRECQEHGIQIDSDQHRDLLAASASLRVPTSERSQSQAG